MSEIKVISIPDLFNKKFFIPSYQRGYRWTERQILDLLEDILEFQKKQNKQRGEFYCLQPLVVKKRNGNNAEYEVIDGQQRLTTIYLILSYLEDARKILFNNDIKKYSIEYETRKGSGDYLSDITKIQNDNRENIDYYFISKAYLSIKEWFEKKNPSPNKADFLNTLLKVDMRDKVDIANNVRFMWYEIEGDQNQHSSIEIFTRINMGKIPLTNAELIKALFFMKEKKDDREKYQFKKAYEWEYIEKSLQNDSFWYFINNSKNDTPTRIEFIFNLIADKYARLKEIKEINVDKSNKYYTFYIFNELINQKVNIRGEGNLQNEEQVCEDLWDEIKTYFRMFEEWFYKNEYYHIIGYLIHTGIEIKDIINLYNKSTKKEFVSNLKNKIQEKIKNNEGKIELKELSFLDDYDKIKSILLLFNIILTNESQYMRFPFDRYVKENWSLEHIHAQNSEEIKKESQRKVLLEEQKRYLEGKNNDNIVKEIDDLLSGNRTINDITFKKLQDEIFKLYADEIDIHTIDNLALLTKEDNSALNNNIFPIKREKIIELDMKGSFIPIGTKNVFLKYYSKNSEQNVKWEKNDRQCYLKAIEDTLNKFLEVKESKNEN